MDKRLVILCAIVGIGMMFASFPDGALSVMVTLVVAIPAMIIIRSHGGEEKKFLINVFAMALIARLVLGIAIHTFDLRGIFGPDAFLYDAIGDRQRDIWFGVTVPEDTLTNRVRNPEASGWGMNYLIGLIYVIFGRSILVAQTFCGVIGALTAPLTYFCAKKIFNNKRVAKLSALSVALFPSFVIWSAQLLKDGLLIFLLVGVMLLLLELQKKISIQSILLLLVCLFGIFALRFYLFYMVAVAVVGSFFVGAGTTVQTVARNLIIVMVIGLALTYLGVIRSATDNLETYGTLERVQVSRQDLATSADSGFGEEIDVSTPAGAISAVPIGLAYLYLAPFPWQIGKLSQAFILPETMLWWMLLPVLFIGLKFTLKNKFRVALPILVFSMMLTLLYSVFQGNVGMLYRQRTQIQVFLFMFIAVGVTLIQERRENAQMVKEMKNRQLIKELRELKQKS